MNHFKKNPVSMAVAATVAGFLTVGTAQAIDYEVWAADQSNSTPSIPAKGTDGSLLWIWDGAAVNTYAAGPSTGAQPAALPCNAGNTPGPCDLHAIFPGTLDEFSSDAAGAAIADTTLNLSDVGPIARLHGAIPDPQHRSVNMNMFAPGNGFVGIISADTKEAISLYRVSKTNAPSGGGRSLHMSFWNADGSQLLLANLHGRILERIDIVRDDQGTITGTTFNQAASVGMGSETAIVETAKVYLGTTNGGANTMIGDIAGAYSAGATSLTYTDTSGAIICKQDSTSAGLECPHASLPGAISGDRGGNVIVCPIVSSDNKVYVTFGGGGLIIVDADTPAGGAMKIVGAYGKASINGAGCGGVEIGGNVYLNAGTSAANGAAHSTFTQYTLPTGFGDGDSATYPDFTENSPAPVLLFADAFNTRTGGNTTGLGGDFAGGDNTSGQLPGATSFITGEGRRDAHGMSPTVSGRYLHVDDRIRNNMEVFNSSTGDRSDPYSLTLSGCLSANMTGGSKTLDGDGGLPQDDAAPDLMATGPNNKYLFTANRGPTPVTVGFNAQGSCPGVGIITLKDHGESGEMTHVLQTTNASGSGAGTMAGGYAYTGAERSDPHGVAILIKQ